MLIIIFSISLSKYFFIPFKNIVKVLESGLIDCKFSLGLAINSLKKSHALTCSSRKSLTNTLKHALNTSIGTVLEEEEKEEEEELVANSNRQFLKIFSTLLKSSSLTIVLPCCFC